jgi:hypothetical protein
MIWSTKEPYSQSSRFQQNKETIEKKKNPEPMFETAQKRDDLNFRVADREMYAQCGMNPFFSNDKNSYAHHVNIQSTLLQPIDTTMTDKSKLPHTN